jgi:hypothetical protein
MSNTDIYQRCLFPMDSALLAARVWMIFYNDPVFTSLTMKVYSERNSSPGKLLYTSSNSPTKASLITLDNGIKEFYFEFNPPTGVPIKANDPLYFVINGTGVSGFDETSHIAWKKAWPDPAYRLGGGTDYNDLFISKHDIAFIGVDL